MNAILVFRDLIPVVMIAVSIFFAIRVIKIALTNNPYIAKLIYKNDIMGLLVLLGLCISCLVILFLAGSKEGWHPMAAIKEVLIGICQGCEAVMH